MDIVDNLFKDIQKLSEVASSILILFSLIVIVTIIILSIIQIIKIRKHNYVNIDNIVISNHFVELGLNKEYLKSIIDISIRELFPKEQKVMAKKMYDIYYMLNKEKYAVLKSVETVNTITKIRGFKDIIHYLINWFIKNKTVKFDIIISFYHDKKNNNQSNNETKWCKLYVNDKLISNDPLDLLKDSKTGFHQLGSRLAYDILKTIVPPCMLSSYLLINSNANMKDVSFMYNDQKKILDKINRKLWFASNTHCCKQCRNIVNHRKILKKCNKLKGYMIIPLGVLARKHINILPYNNSNIGYIEDKITIMQNAIKHYYNSQHFAYQIVHYFAYRARLICLNYFLAKALHKKFIENSYKELREINKNALEVADLVNKIDGFLQNKEETKTKIYKIYNTCIVHVYLIFKNVKVFIAISYHNLADISFRLGENQDNVKKKIYRYLNKSIFLYDRNMLSRYDFMYYSFRFHKIREKGNRCLRQYFHQNYASHIDEARFLKLMIELFNIINIEHINNEVKEKDEKVKQDLKENNDFIKIVNKYSNKYNKDYRIATKNLLGISTLFTSDAENSIVHFNKAINLCNAKNAKDWWAKSIILNNKMIAQYIISENEYEDKVKNNLINPIILNNMMYLNSNVDLKKNLEISDRLFSKFRTDDNMVILSLVDENRKGGWIKTENGHSVKLKLELL